MHSIIGIDVSKYSLEISNLKGLSSCKNTKEGISKLTKKLKSQNPSLVALEPTGGYERLLTTTLSKNEIPFSMLNPARVREFAKSMNFVKTDNKDAEIIAIFADVSKAKPSIAMTEEDKEASDLINRRRQLIDMRTAELNRLEHASKALSKEINEHIDYINKRVKEIDKTLNASIKSNDERFRKITILESAPGIGRVLSTTLLVLLPELGVLNNKQIARLVGLAPLNKDSGTQKKRRHTIGGRMEVKSMLYMAGMSAITNNPVIKAFYERLCKSGKLKMVALVASMRKLIVRLNAMVRDNVKWGEFA